MNAEPETSQSEMGRFRTKLLVAMMLVVSAITAIGLMITQRQAADTVEQELEREFQAELTALQTVQELRYAALVERCRVLVRKARIHAALEDDALDLLYPSAMDELRDLMTTGEEPGDLPDYGLRAEFYRFLDRRGSVISPIHPEPFGRLSPEEEARLALPAPPDRPQLGYMVRRNEHGHETVAEILGMPIISTENAEIIAVLVLGFKPATFAVAPSTAGMLRGLWLDGRFHSESLPRAEQTTLAGEITRAIASRGGRQSSFRREVEGVPHLLFYKRLNPDSLLSPAYEVCVYPLTELEARQRRLRWQVLGSGALLLLGGLGASHFLAGKLSRPVEKLAVASEENLQQRARAEAALESTSEELQRAARFSADASHQLKTPVTVLRAGLEDLLARDHFTADECHEISALIHQTYRLSSVIEDLLLLSRMDAGRLAIEFAPVNLTHLIDAALDDLGAQPDSFGLDVQTEFPGTMWVAGEKRYIALILQNLFENARKYNRPGGLIRIGVREEQGMLYLRVANTGQPILAQAQEHIFERFHRGSIGENVAGYGLGLNLARELARLHGGDLMLIRSDAELTEFEVRFRTIAAGSSFKDGVT